MGEKVEIKSISPFLQELLIERIRAALSARDTRDYELYADRLRTLILLTPSKVKRRLAWITDEKLGTEDVLELIDDMISECREKEQEYVPDFEYRAVVSECWRRTAENLDYILGALLEVLHDEGVFTEVRRIEAREVG